MNLANFKEQLVAILENRTNFKIDKEPIPTLENLRNNRLWIKMMKLSTYRRSKSKTVDLLTTVKVLLGQV
jgi:hypothetical protein